MMTPLPIDDDREPTGGGTPNLDALPVGGAQISPASLFVQTVSAVSETLEESAPAPELTTDDDYPLTWTGAPTKAALQRIALESRVPAFDADAAALVLTGLWEGRTLRSLCRTPGYPTRAMVMGWAALVPRFAELLEQAQVALGAEMRDRAVEELEGVDADGTLRAPDGAVARAWLATAAAFDRRIAKGDVENTQQVGIVVNVKREFG